MKEKLIFVNNCLKELRAIMPEDAIVDADFIRFQDGAAKVKLPTECRDQDVFIICDVNDKTPNPYTGHVLSPDDHVRDIERTIGALKNNPARKNLIIPFQPYGRQHRREFGESTEAADYLRDCHYLGFRNILTVDSHDPDVSAAISKHNFDNMFVTNEMLKEMVINEKIDYTHPENILVVAPDEGAQKRARHFADRFGCNHAFFSKRRDVTKIVDGKNPLVSKQFVGFSPENKTVIIVDDMISSGGTIIETAKELKKMGAKITIEGKTAVIKGVRKLSGAKVKSTDLRGGACLVLAGLAAKGITTVTNIEYILRGYENIDKKLNKLGAKIILKEGEN